MKKRSRGFTLAEVLIVVAIIAVLVAVAIPVFTSQLEKARQATDLANIRSAYAAASAKVITTGLNQSASAGVMKHTGVFSKLSDARIGNLDLKEDEGSSAAGAIIKGYQVDVNVAVDGSVTLSLGGWDSSLAGQTSTSEELSVFNLLDVWFDGATIHYKTSAVGVEYTEEMTIGTPSDTVFWNSSATSTNYYYKWDGAHWYYVTGAGEVWKMVDGT